MSVVIDTALLVERRRRALLVPADGADFLIRRIAEDLGDRLSLVERRFPDAATLHCVTGHARDALMASGKVDRVIRYEVDAAFLAGDAKGVVCAPETLPAAPESLDLILSLMSLQEVNDIPGLLVQARRALRPDGLFLAAMAGAGTLGELRNALLAAEVAASGGASPRIAPFADVRDAGALLQRAGFALPVTDTDTLTVRYSDALSLMHDLRAMGATNTLVDRSRRPLRRDVLFDALRRYAQDHAEADGKVRATFSIIWMSGWAPAATQQKPARPGSATKLLSDALKETKS
jgi:SAM-dependent methyltransferase